MFGTVLVSSGAGLVLSSLVPWSDPAKRAGIPQAFGLTIAPFILGIFTVLVLGVLRGASHAVHLGSILGALIVSTAGVIAIRPAWSKAEPASERYSTGLLDFLLGGVLATWGLGLIFNATLLPLIQNDSLEYATVGRLLFELRDLMVYPAIDPNVGSSGFYGPWTHPPLYVALIYLAYVFQGNADTPGLMRLVAPWFALSATFLIYSIGRLSGRLAGIVSGLFFISVPLFFLGADSALIDSLPVAGFTLIFAAIVAQNYQPIRYGLVVGGSLGIALWTHSQAVLFIPMALSAVILYNWRNGFHHLFLEVIAILVTSFTIAAWPYVRNLFLFGSLISDNPAVFAIPELAWKEYFSISRGIDSWPNIIQYGVLKGWFAVEAYSLVFWLMSAGILIYIIDLIEKSSRHMSLRDVFQSEPICRLSAALGAVGCYFAGVAASALAGIDLMIRNERYWLVLLPCAVIFSAEAIIRINDYGKSSLKSQTRTLRAKLANWIGPAVIFFFIFQLFVVVLGYRWSRYFEPGYGVKIKKADVPSLKDYLNKKDIKYSLKNQKEISLWNRSTGNYSDLTVNIMDDEKYSDLLGQWPQIAAVQYLNSNLPEKSVVLSFRPADMYYSKRRMISYLDPRLVSLYGEKNASNAFNQLKMLGVTHLHIPEYYLPVIYNSVISEVLSRPDLTTLVFSEEANQVYELRRNNDFQESISTNFRPGSEPWTLSNNLTGGRKALAHFSESTSTIVMKNDDTSNIWFPFFQRDFSKTLISGIGGWYESASLKSFLPVSSVTEYRIDLQLKGHSFVKIWLMQFDSNGRALQGVYLLSSIKTRLGEIVLSPKYPERWFKRRFISQPEAAYVRVGVEYMGNSKIHIQDAILTEILKKHTEF